jgi:hypothetical protein
MVERRYEMPMVKVECDSYGAWDKLTTEQYEAARLLFPNLPEKRPSDKYGYYGAEGVLELDTIMAFTEATGVKVMLKPMAKGMAFFNREGMVEKFERLSDDMHLVKQKLSFEGQVVQIHVPNFTLLNMNQVMLLEDCCTDQLQKELDNGWRILCICPPLNERWPTYILGRHTPEESLEKGRSACRRSY